jgi:hypothetical protein
VVRTSYCFNVILLMHVFQGIRLRLPIKDVCCAIVTRALQQYVAAILARTNDTNDIDTVKDVSKALMCPVFSYLFNCF